MLLVTADYLCVESSQLCWSQSITFYKLQSGSKRVKAQLQNHSHHVISYAV